MSKAIKLNRLNPSKFQAMFEDDSENNRIKTLLNPLKPVK